MRSHSNNKQLSKGFTLIEAIIYVALFSSLLATYVPYSYSINEQNQRLLQNINDGA